MLLLQMDGNLLKNQKGVKNKSWVCAEVVQKLAQFAYTFAYTFWKSLVNPVVSDYTTRHRSLIGKGGQLFALVCFRHSHKGFQRIDSSTNKGNNSAIKYRHFTDTPQTLLFVHCLFKKLSTKFVFYYEWRVVTQFII